MAEAGSLFAASERLRKRHRKGTIAKYLLLSTVLTSVLMLVVLLGRLFRDGAMLLDPAFWTTRYNPLELDDTLKTGMMDSILSTLSILGMTMALALPFGVAAGIYLTEYAGKGRLTEWIRAAVANLAGVPSVVYGLFGLAVFVRFMEFGASNIAAALTLAVLILPVIIVATEEALKAVPATVREASLAMGATKWRTIRSHVLPYALPGILTGNILAMSRAAGETAPLLALGIVTFSSRPEFDPLGTSTPLQVRGFHLILEPEHHQIEIGAAAILALLAVTLAMNLVAIVLRQILSNRIKW